jgi:hypothetical protein
MSTGTSNVFKKGAITGMTHTTAATAAIHAARNSWLRSQFIARLYHRLSKSHRRGTRKTVSGDGSLGRSTIPSIVRHKGKDQRESPQRWWAEKFVVPIVVAILGAGGVSAIIVAVIQHERVSVVSSPKPDPPGVHYFTVGLSLLSAVSEYNINLYVDGQLVGTFSGNNKTYDAGIKSSVSSLGQHNYNFTGQLKLGDSTYSAYGSGTISIIGDGDMLEADMSDAAPVASNNLWFSLKKLD